MAFKYSHKDASIVWPKGDYEAVIKSAVEGRSKSSGNPMLTVTFTVYNSKGGEMLIDEYIVPPPPDGSSRGSIFKLGAIAKAIGKSDEFKADTFDVARYVGTGLVLELDTEEGTGDFPDKNRIKKYKPLDRGTSGKPVTYEPITEGDIPF